MHDYALKNRVFMYLPFETPLDMDALSRKFSDSQWELFTDNEMGYLYTYASGVTRHDDESSPGGGASYIHYRLKPNSTSLTWFTSGAWEMAGSTKRLVKASELVDLRAVHCYLFATGISILSFEMAFRASDGNYLCDPCELAPLLWRTHRVGSKTRKGLLSQGNRIRLRGNRTSKGKTLLELARELTESLGVSEVRFFSHLDEADARANVFVFLEHPETEISLAQMSEEEALSAARERMPLAFIETTEDIPLAEMTYLATPQNTTGYSWGRSMIIMPSMMRYGPDIRWGISNEVLACITYPELFARKGYSHRKFITGVFAHNVCTHYQFLYVLLLHQKFFYCSLLTTLSSHDMDSYEALLNYKNRLESFHADYVYTHVSDVAQYQTMYERVYEEFNLDRMNADIRKPLDSLAKLQQQTEKRKNDLEEAEREKRDRHLNNALNLLALLAVVSSISDVRELCDWLGASIGETAGNVVFVIVCILAVVVIVYSLYSLFSNIRFELNGATEHEES